MPASRDREQAARAAAEAFIRDAWCVDHRAGCPGHTRAVFVLVETGQCQECKRRVSPPKPLLDSLTALLLAREAEVVRECAGVCIDPQDEAAILAILPPPQSAQPATPKAACAHCGIATPIECGVCVTCGRRVQPATPERAAEGGHCYDYSSRCLGVSRCECECYRCVAGEGR